MSSPLLAPSILAADFANLQRDVELINRSAADWIHVDVMDGRFVPNISFGLPVCEAIHRHATKPLDVHLMIVEPERYLAAFAKAGARTLSVHLEACPNLHRTVQQIRELGCSPGVAINPHTPVSLLSEIIDDIDLVLIMSVNPGFGGQAFIERSVEKVRQVRALSTRVQIEVDGGVNLDNAPRLLQAGADVLVAGSFVFSAPDPERVIAELKELGERLVDNG
jgi:ribulose-phosphate 3-epimerase